MANHQQQAEQDLCQLMDVCGNTLDRMDRRVRRIEAAYNRPLGESILISSRRNCVEQIMAVLSHTNGQSQ